MTKKPDKEDGKEIVYHFVGDGSQVISDAPSEDITEEMWQQLPEHVQRSVAHSPLYKRGKGDDEGSADETADDGPYLTVARATVLVAEPKEEPRKAHKDTKPEKSDKE